MAKPHTHPAQLQAPRTTGEAAADIAAAAAGSWRFIWAYTLITILWLAGNALLFRFDPYPWQAYTAAVSILAILLAALILLAGNRQAQIDRAHAENAYHQIKEIDDLQTEQLTLLELQHTQLELLQSIKDLATAGHADMAELINLDQTKNTLHAQLDTAYSDRNLAVQLAAEIASWLNLSVSTGYDRDTPDPAWPVLFIQLPTGQVSWHIPRDELILQGFPTDGEWDGHSPGEKQQRIKDLIAGKRH